MQELFLGNPVFIDTLIYVFGKFIGKDSTEYENILNKLQMLGHKHKVNGDVKAKYKQYENLLKKGSSCFITGVLESFQSVVTALNNATATTSKGQETLDNLKELLSIHLPDFLNKIQNNVPTLLKELKILKSSPNKEAKIKEIAETYLSLEQLEFIKKMKDKNFTVILKNPSSIGIKNFDLTRRDLHSIFIKAVKPKLSNEVIPELLKFIGDDHPLATMILSAAQKLLSGSQNELEKFKDVFLELKRFG